MNIKEVQNNVKENLKYFVNGDDDFETIINKILEKLSKKTASLLLDKIQNKERRRR